MRKNLHRFRLPALALAVALACSTPMVADAAGLGRITVLSALGQPLRAELEITATRDELNSLSAQMASAEAFRVAGIEYVGVLASIRFSREVKERNGKHYITVSTDLPVNEPFIDMLVELNWASGRLVREYTFLLDPPDSVIKRPPTTTEAPPVSTPLARPAAEKPVEVRPLPLAPAHAAEAPTTEKRPVAPIAKPAQEPAARTETAGGSRVVKSGDTLGKIAAETRPAGVSLDQMLVALFRSNSEAFDGNNMNRLRAGKILAIPEAASVAEVAPEEAKREVVAQAADFNAYRRRLAEMVEKAPAAPESPSRAASGKIAPKVEEKAPPAPGKDKLEVSRTELPAKEAKAPPMQGRLAALEEDLVARDRALREANSRIAQLEKNLGDLKELAKVKSSAGAALQKQAETTKPGEAAKASEAPKPAETPKPVEAPKPAEAVKPAETPKPAEPAKPAEAAKPAEPAKPEEARKPVETKAPEAPKPPPKKVLPPPDPEPEPDFIEENPLLVFGGGGVLAALLGYLGFAAYRRKKKAAATEPISQSDLSTGSVFTETASQSVQASEAAPSEFSVSESVAEAGAEAVDPLVEADTYLAFGRDAQAEEILLQALKTEPTRHAVHVKLLEIYSARRSTLQFNTLARELREQTGGEGAEWERAAAMGLALDPSNALYQAPAAEAPAVEPPAPDMAATMVFSAPPPMTPAPAEAAPAAEEAATLDFDLDLGESTAAAPASEPAAGEAGIAALDFDLDLGEPAAEPPKPADETPASDGAMALDIDFALDEPAPEAPAALEVPSSEEMTALPSDEAEVASLAMPLEAEALQIPQAAPDTGNVIDFSLDLDLPTPAAAVEVPPAAPAAATATDEASVDFDFDLGAPAAAEDTAAAAPALDMDAISLDLELPEASPPAAAELSLDDLSLPEIGAEEPVAPAPATSAEEAPMADDPEAATKLELALAYEEMGDREGARELLQEVLSEGSPAQRAAAQAKLEKLG